MSLSLAGKSFEKHGAANVNQKYSADHMCPGVDYTEKQLAGSPADYQESSLDDAE